MFSETDFVGDVLQMLPAEHLWEVEASVSTTGFPWGKSE